jgi:pimeloyl-ACP methyl ester carboxylesterase
VHGTAEIEPGLRLHHVTSGEGDRILVLLHGFPQTWHEWRKLIPLLAAEGFRVIAPDYRGAGNSSRPLGGYDKKTMAGDIRRLLRDALGITSPVILCGHDIGLMVAFAYAQAFPDEVTHLVVMDAPLPGTAVFDRLRADPRVWQFAFHNVRDVPEMLVAGRERLYLRTFFDARLFDPSAIDQADLDIYTAAYAGPGGMRAGFELYRAFDRDIRDVRDALSANGKLRIPVLAVGGDISTSGPLMAEMMREVAKNVSELRVPRTGHWIAEENAEGFLNGLLAFLRTTARK